MIQVSSRVEKWTAEVWSKDRTAHLNQTQSNPTRFRVYRSRRAASSPPPPAAAASPRTFAGERPGMWAVRSLRRNLLRAASSPLHPRCPLPPGSFAAGCGGEAAAAASARSALLPPPGAWGGWWRRRMMSTTKGRSMRSKVEKRMARETGRTQRELRRAVKLRKKLMTDDERLIYSLRRVKAPSIFFLFFWKNWCLLYPVAICFRLRSRIELDFTCACLDDVYHVISSSCWMNAMHNFCAQL